MRNRTAKTLLSLTTIIAFALPGVAQARHGADDPAGHVRHSSHARHHGTHHKRHAHHHATATARHGGADDGPNHR
jgi:hypothetical protein